MLKIAFLIILPPFTIVNHSDTDESFLLTLDPEVNYTFLDSTEPSVIGTFSVSDSLPTTPKPAVFDVGSALFLSWSATEAAVLYRLRHVVDGVSSIIYEGTTNNFSFTHNTTVPQYRFSVQSCISNCGPLSEELVFNVPQPPPSVTNMTVSLSCPSAEVMWSPQDSSATAFQVFLYLPPNQDPVVSEVVPTTSTMINDLLFSSSYTVVVKAVNGVGESAPQGLRALLLLNIGYFIVFYFL